MPVADIPVALTSRFFQTMQKFFFPNYTAEQESLEQQQQLKSFRPTTPIPLALEGWNTIKLQLYLFHAGLMVLLL